MRTLAVGVFARASALSFCLLILACGRSEQNTTTPATTPAQSRAVDQEAAISSALSASDRFTGDSDQDEWRSPRIVLQFFGVEPGMHVLDYFAGDGYFSELLARAVGPSGSVIVYNNAGYAEFAGEKLTKRFADNRLPNAKVVTTSTADLKLEPNSLDGVLFYWAYHDLYWTPKNEKEPLGDPAKVTAMLFNAVKPGGEVVVIDHIANSGGDTAEVVGALHRIDPQTIKSDFTKAGFVFDSESDALKHAGDDHTKPVFDPSVQHKTDQLMFKFRKPR